MRQAAIQAYSFRSGLWPISFSDNMVASFITATGAGQVRGHLGPSAGTVCVAGHAVPGPIPMGLLVQLHKSLVRRFSYAAAVVNMLLAEKRSPDRVGLRHRNGPTHANARQPAPPDHFAHCQGLKPNLASFRFRTLKWPREVKSETEVPVSSQFKWCRPE